MQERRKEERVPIDRNIEVMDRLYDEKIGMLVDISPRGIGVRGDHAIEVNDEVKLLLRLPDKILGKQSIFAVGVCVWCRPDTDPQYWLSGFEFYSVLQEDSSAILGLILDIKENQ